MQQSPDKMLAAFDKEFGEQTDGFAVTHVLFVGQAQPLPEKYEQVQVDTCTTVKRAAKRILSYTDPDVSVLCMGDPSFAYSIKTAVSDALIGLS